MTLVRKSGCLSLQQHFCHSGLKIATIILRIFSRIVFHLGQEPSPVQCPTPGLRRFMASAGPQGCVALKWRDTNTFTPIILNAGQTGQQAQTNHPVCKGNIPWGILCTTGSCFYLNWDSFFRHSAGENMCFLFVTFPCE